MRTCSFLTLLGLLVSASFGVGCKATPAPSPEVAYQPAATIKDIMISIVDPEADVLWQSVATIISAAGTEERYPKTDEEWVALRRAAVQLVEAPNLLLMPGRHVARPGERSENPDVELEPAAMQKLIDEDPVNWRKLALALQEAALPALKAIDEKNVQALFDSGETLDQACEACHRHYWYPPTSAPIWRDTVGRK